MFSTFDMINRIKLNRSMQRKGNYFSKYKQKYSVVEDYNAASFVLDVEKLEQIRLKWKKQDRFDRIKRIVILVSVIVAAILYVF